MPVSDIDDIADVLSKGTIIAIVVSSVIGVALLIVFIVILICIINRCNKPRHPQTQGIILQQPYSYTQTWPTQYPQNLTSVSNYPPPYESVPPPYTAPSAPVEATKSPYT